MTDRIKLLGLNSWGREGPWNKRLSAIGRGIRALDPHVVGLSEIWEDGAGNSAGEIAAAIGGDWHIHYAPSHAVMNGDLQIRTEGNAILSRFPIVDREAWPLPEPTGDHERNLVFGIVETPWGRLPTFVTHLSWMMHWSAARLMQAQQLRDWVKQRAPIQRGDAPTDMLPPIVIGDLNAPPHSDELRFLTGLMADPYGCFFADSFAWAGEGRGFTWDRRNPYTQALPLPDRRIDYILVRGPDRWCRGEPLVSRVVLDEPDDGAYPSDHYGVYTELRATAQTAVTTLPASHGDSFAAG